MGGPKSQGLHSKFKFFAQPCNDCKVGDIHKSPQSCADLATPTPLATGHLREICLQGSG